MSAMTAGSILSTAQRRFLTSARRMTLVTGAADGTPRPVPICFVLADEGAVLLSPVDEKPKRSDDPMALARIHDISADPRVAVLADRWDEDWSRLAWLRAIGSAVVTPPWFGRAGRPLCSFTQAIHGTLPRAWPAPPAIRE